jgi:hypothetical protein
VTGDFSKYRTTVQGAKSLRGLRETDAIVGEHSTELSPITRCLLKKGRWPLEANRQRDRNNGGVESERPYDARGPNTA